MSCGPSKDRKVVCWRPPPSSWLKFNVDGAAKGKLGPADIGGVLRNGKGEVLFMFSKNVGIKESNEAKVLAILEALRIFSFTLKENLIVESDSSNAIRWVSKVERGPWRFQYYLNEIKALSSSIKVSFSHICRSADGMVNSLAKQGVHRVVLLVAPIA